ncbi:RluA family pseudouridine synthase [Aestuariibius insulae]|uniref:RluA family pseudouridine synthase n=1 Tax=Aestuariibius insulae TaxID=2058287 RepID=UPI00345EEEDE
MSSYAPPTDPLAILRADDHLLFVDKPEGLLSVPGKGAHLADCLLARLEADFPGVLLVHRLDRDTSGVMVFALTPKAQRHLGLQFEKRIVEKRYIARVAGRIGEGGRFDGPLRADWPNRPRQMIAPDGRAAITDWERIEVSEQESRVALRPLTGRSHQLRVHLAEAGHPILGDPLYDGPPADRMMLHAERLRLRHPDGGAWIEVISNVPF